MGEVLLYIYAFALVVGLVAYGAAWLVLLIWQWLLLVAGLWLAFLLGKSAWKRSDARRRLEHRRRLAEIEAITRDTVERMVEIAIRN